MGNEKAGNISYRNLLVSILSRLRRYHYQYFVPTFQIYSVWWPTSRITSPHWVRNVEDGNKRKSQRPGEKPVTGTVAAQQGRGGEGRGREGLSTAFLLTYVRDDAF